MIIFVHSSFYRSYYTFPIKPLITEDWFSFATPASYPLFIFSFLGIQALQYNPPNKTVFTYVYISLITSHYWTEEYASTIYFMLSYPMNPNCVTALIVNRVCIGLRYLKCMYICELVYKALNYPFGLFVDYNNFYDRLTWFSFRLFRILPF